MPESATDHLLENNRRYAAGTGVHRSFPGLCINR